MISTVAFLLAFFALGNGQEKDCYNKPFGSEYRGTRSYTLSGKTCQHWSKDSPHWHIYKPSAYPDGDLRENYCRNPDESLGPWCYTTDPSQKWEYCLRMCTDPCYNKTFGDDYRGTQSRTLSGITCQNWSQNKPHVHNFKQINYPKADLNENYCRNPDKSSGGPWCFTNDVNTRWGYCFPMCTESFQCHNTNEPFGSDYRGTQRVTLSGKTCQHWSQNTPHNHIYNPSSYPNDDLRENYCRNPDKSKRPWCYTVNANKRWEYCFPVCSDPNICPPQDNFLRKIMYTGEAGPNSDGLFSTETGVFWEQEFGYYGSHSPYFRFESKQRVIKLTFRVLKPVSSTIFAFFGSNDCVNWVRLLEMDYGQYYSNNYRRHDLHKRRMEWTIPCHLRNYYYCYRLEIFSHELEEISLGNLEMYSGLHS